MNIQRSEFTGGVIMMHGGIIGLDFGALSERAVVDVTAFEEAAALSHRYARRGVRVIDEIVPIRTMQMNVMVVVAPGVRVPPVTTSFLIDHNMASTNTLTTGWGTDGFVCVYRHALRSALDALKTALVAGDFAMIVQQFTRFEGIRARFYDAETIPNTLAREWEQEDRLVYS